jgi:hypothetical protein
VKVGRSNDCRGRTLDVGTGGCLVEPAEKLQATRGEGGNQLQGPIQAPHPLQLASTAALHLDYSKPQWRRAGARQVGAVGRRRLASSWRSSRHQTPP